MAGRGRPRKVQEVTPMDDIISRLARMEERLNHIHKDVERNASEVADLRKQVAMGKGGLKVILWLGAVVGGLVAAWQGLFNVRG
tara:strand:+ start:255 stop:506 length:252 start_codon:yes stop_codon:yes gene_type:complete